MVLLVALLHVPSQATDWVSEARTAGALRQQLREVHLASGTVVIGTTDGPTLGVLVALPNPHPGKLRIHPTADPATLEALRVEAHALCVLVVEPQKPKGWTLASVGPLPCPAPVSTTAGPAVAPSHATAWVSEAYTPTALRQQLREVRLASGTLLVLGTTDGRTLGVLVALPNPHPGELRIHPTADPEVLDGLRVEAHAVCAIVVDPREPAGWTLTSVGSLPCPVPTATPPIGRPPRDIAHAYDGSIVGFGTAGFEVLGIFGGAALGVLASPDAGGFGNLYGWVGALAGGGLGVVTGGAVLASWRGLPPAPVALAALTPIVVAVPLVWATGEANAGLVFAAVGAPIGAGIAAHLVKPRSMAVLPLWRDGAVGLRVGGHF